MEIIQINTVEQMKANEMCTQIYSKTQIQHTFLLDAGNKFA